MRHAQAASATTHRQELGAWKLLERFIGVLDKHGASVAPDPRKTHGLRQLDRRTYFGLFLFGLFNPVVGSMRGLCGATRIERAAGMLDRQGSVAISGFSDAQHVFSPDILQPVMRELLTESLARQPAGLKKSVASLLSPTTSSTAPSGKWSPA